MSFFTKVVDWCVQLQGQLPNHFIARIVHRVSNCKIRWVKNIAIYGFSKLFAIDLAEAEKTSIKQYSCFNDFFTRRLKRLEKCTPDKKYLFSPVDGGIYQIAQRANEERLQVKGCCFQIEKLLGSSQHAELFSQASYAVLYLSPSNYHRIHMPTDGKLLSMNYIPGKLFPVHGQALRAIPELFARNERVVSLFETQHGKMAIVAVGAFMVGSIKVSWEKERIAPANQKIMQNYQYDQHNIHLQQGAEWGHFLMGSTVVVLFEQGKIQWNTESKVGYPVYACTPIGSPVVTHSSSP